MGLPVHGEIGQSAHGGTCLQLHKRAGWSAHEGTGLPAYGGTGWPVHWGATVQHCRCCSSRQLRVHARCTVSESACALAVAATGSCVVLPPLAEGGVSVGGNSHGRTEIELEQAGAKQCGRSAPLHLPLPVHTTQTGASPAPVVGSAASNPSLLTSARFRVFQLVLVV